MSFLSFDPQPLRTREQVAREVHAVSLQRGLDELATVLAVMTISTEVGANGQYWCPSNAADPDSQNYPHDSESDDGRSCGYFQQQKGPDGSLWWGTSQDEMTLASAANNFLDRLADNYADCLNNPALAGQFCQQVQGSAFPDRYAAKWDEAWQVVNLALADTSAPPVVPPLTSNAPTPPETTPVAGKPGYNELEHWSSSNQGRNGTKVDLFLIHTQEGGGGDSAAEDLANFLCDPANQVSYHYTISQASDGGVTLFDVVDTDDACWAVGDANDRSINLCFAGSSVSWSRDRWLEQANAIDVAAYIAVQDCKKYGISLDVVPPPYNGTPGISDHYYVTKVLSWGTHIDVGPNFPWDVLAAAVAKYASLDTEPASPPADPPAAPPVSAPVVAAPTPVGPADDQLTLRWNQLGGQTLVEAVAEIRDHVLGTNDRTKAGAV